MHLVRQISRHLQSGALEELTLTTNGSQLSRFAAELADCGVKRINVSLDTLDADKFHKITRWGHLGKVMEGIDAAQAAGLKVKLNAVALKDFNDAELPEMMRWAHGRGMDLTVIETMPMGEIDADRTDQYLPLSLLRASLERQFTLTDIGSDWTETGITHVITHKGETRIRTSAVPMFNKQPNAAGNDNGDRNGTHSVAADATRAVLPSRLIAKLVGLLY